ncbi:MAG TPA: LysM peptidoglycan-binding domain-containing protein [Croceibacterium sp.]|nr:LysM peptidoglycan-binding domain-containing protein [Croceibacterium sp.]
MAQYQTYTVRRGDTLARIAARTHTTVGELVALNGLANPDRILAGQVLNIRRVSATSYVVQPRDTLWAIARHYGVTVAELARASGIDVADPLQIGQTLIVPDQVPEPTFPPAAGKPLPVTTPAGDVPRPGASSVKAAALAKARVLPRSAGKCYRYVKQALLAGGAVDHYLGGGSAIEAGPELVAQGFVDIFGLPAAGIRSPYDAPVGAVLVYKATATATDRNRVHGHIEMRVEGGFASDYFSPRARTGPESNGTALNSSSGRALAGVYVKPDRPGPPAALRPTAAPPASPARPTEFDPYSVANLKLDPLNGKYLAAITEAAARTGMAPQTVAAIIEAEAAKVPGTRQWDANSKAATSSARGLTQFLDATWIGEATRAGGLLNAEAKAAGTVSADNRVIDRARLLQMRFDPRVSILAGADFAVANLAFLAAKGVLPATVDPAGKAKLAYLAHHEGAPGAVKFLRGEMGYVSTATFNANVPASKRTAALAAAGGSTGMAYRDYIGSYIDSRIVVTNYMVVSDGVVVPKLRSFFL